MNMIILDLETVCGANRKLLRLCSFRGFLKLKDIHRGGGASRKAARNTQTRQVSWLWLPKRWNSQRWEDVYSVQKYLNAYTQLEVSKLPWNHSGRNVVYVGGDSPPPTSIEQQIFFKKTEQTRKCTSCGRFAFQAHSSHVSTACHLVQPEGLHISYERKMCYWGGGKYPSFC